MNVKSSSTISEDDPPYISIVSNRCPKFGYSQAIRAILEIFDNRDYEADLFEPGETEIIESEDRVEVRIICNDISTMPSTTNDDDEDDLDEDSDENEEGENDPIHGD